MAKSFDVTLLARGMSSRCIGARIASQITTLSNEEIEKDLRHMEAYQNACTVYSQQYFIHQNRALVHSGHYGLIVPPTQATGESYVNGDSVYNPYRPVMPVRIDPEEEKRVSLLRKRIASSEAQREVLETEYMSLRAHYVFASQRVKKSRQMVTTQLKILKQLVQARAQVIALRRVRVAVARDVWCALERRTMLLDNRDQASIAPPVMTSVPRGPDVLDVWNELEIMIFKAEKSCRSLELDVPPKRAAQSKSPTLNKRKRGETEDENAAIHLVVWDGRVMSRTPNGVPILISQMSKVPDKAAGIGCGQVFGSKPQSMIFFEENLPATYEDMEEDHEDVTLLHEEAEKLRKELLHERVANKDLQKQIIQKRKRNTEMCAMMTLLRSETEAVLGRHNILLDTQEARQAASDLHQKAFEEHEQRCENGVDADEGDLVDETLAESFPQESGLHEEHDNDGDDEGSGGEEEEEEGELMEPSRNEFILGEGTDGNQS